MKRSDASIALRGLLMRLTGQGATAAAIATRYNVRAGWECAHAAQRRLLQCPPIEAAG